MPKISEVTWASLLLIGIGAMGACHYGVLLKKAASTDDWPTVSGQIVVAEYVYDAAIGRSHRSFGYRYQVGNRSFESDRVSWANTGRSGVGLFAAGDQIKVYINPDDPKEAVLIPGTDTWTKVQIVLCLLFSLLGVWLMVNCDKDANKR